LKDALSGVFAGEFGGDIEEFYSFLGDTMDVVAELSKAFITFGVNYGAILIGFIQSTKDWTDNTDAVKTIIQVINTVVGALGLVMAGVYDAGQLILYGWQSIGTAVHAAYLAIAENFYGALLSAVELADKLPFVDMKDEIAALRDVTKQMVDEQDKLWADLPERPAMLTDNVASAIIKVDEYARSITTAGEGTKKTGEAIEKTAEGIATFTGSVQAVIDILDELDKKEGETADTTSELAERFKIVAGQVFDVAAEAEEYADALDRVTPATGEWLRTFDAAGNVLAEVWVEFDKVTESTKKSGEAAQDLTGDVDDLQRKLSQEMTIQIQDTEAKVKIATIKTQADAMVSIFKFRAEVDIAQITAAAQIATAQWDAMAANASIVEASINKIKDIADISPLNAFKIAAAAAEIAEAQVGLVKSQREYVDAQTAILELQAKAIERGEDVAIKVEIIGDSSTWLEGLLNDLLEEIMVKASQEAFQCLCGTLPPV
jgi:predicted NUDIX family NTP pyrophosphohydrolase